jgi:hypothetical protein
MNYYNKDQLEKDTAQSRGMFFKEIPKMFGYLLFFYALLGFGIPWRMELPREVMWNSAKASVIFGATQGGIMLAVGAIFMSVYALRKATYTDFGPASSLTMRRSFLVFGVVGVPMALWDVFRVLLPEAGSAGERFAQDWWIWLLLVGGVAGWFSGRAIGGLIGLLSIWLSGRQLLRQL